MTINVIVLTCNTYIYINTIILIVSTIITSYTCNNEKIIGL